MEHIRRTRDSDDFLHLPDALAGKLQITRETYELIKEEFVCKPRGKVMVKGKGELETW